MASWVFWAFLGLSGLLLVMGAAGLGLARLALGLEVLIGLRRNLAVGPAGPALSTER